MMQNLNRRRPGLVYEIAFLFAFVAAFTFLALSLPKESSAASLANFRPGNIISDYTMGNYTSMTVEEIDMFLHDHGNCNNTNIGVASWYTSVHYHIKDGHFVCLADEIFATSGTNYGDLLKKDEKYQTAAEIIYEISQTFRINPQVLIVLLEKEQGLISDSWPNSLQYRSATGFGCPDTAPCDSQYYGLKNQLESAAWLFRTVLDGGWTNYPVGENYIGYNPNSACGGSTVYVENLATSSLYRYTPYQPNAAALAAGYGTVSCGAYGNRNFYLFFMDWFGDPTEDPESSTKWIDLETPRYLTTSEDTSFINPFANNKETNAVKAGTTYYYTSKTIGPNDEWCLRTEEQTNNKRNECVVFSSVEEPSWELAEMDEPRYLRLTEKSSEITLSTRNTKSIETGIYKFFDRKITLPNGLFCLIEKGADGKTCIEFNTLKEADVTTYKMENPRKMSPTEDGIAVKNYLTGATVKTLNKDETIFFTEKILLEGTNEWCLALGETKNYTCVPLSNLKNAWVAMESPRELVAKSSTYKKDANTLEEDHSIWIPTGTVRKFTTKAQLFNGSWCLRTEFDSDRDADLCLRLEELSEI